MLFSYYYTFYLSGKLISIIIIIILLQGASTLVVSATPGSDGIIQPWEHNFTLCLLLNTLYTKTAQSLIYSSILYQVSLPYHSIK